MENKFTATSQRDEVIEKLLKMGLSPLDLRWLAEGLIERAIEMEEYEWLKLKCHVKYMD